MQFRRPEQDFVITSKLNLNVLARACFLISAKCFDDLVLGAASSSHLNFCYKSKTINDQILLTKEAKKDDHPVRLFWVCLSSQFTVRSSKNFDFFHSNFCLSFFLEFIFNLVEKIKSCVISLKKRTTFFNLVWSVHCFHYFDF